MFGLRRTLLLPTLLVMLGRLSAASAASPEDAATSEAGVRIDDLIGKNIPIRRVGTGAAANETLKKGRKGTRNNDPCNGGGSRNGTCYTLEECNSKGGSSSAECASGFGVCCIFTISCGSTTAENCTYLVESSVTSVSPNPCEYTICPCSGSVCRIRLDFSTFDISGPYAGTVAAAASSVVGGAIGDCLTDTFSITAPGNRGSPIICGFNSGQHMIVDASTSCHKAVFGLGSATTTRSWDIKVTQYACGAENAGPDGCLQWFTGTTGVISNYNFPTTATSVTSSVTHLSSQCYAMCIRVEAGQCGICFIPNIVAAIEAAATQDSFGLSRSPSGTIAQQTIGTNCVEDYLIIPNAQAAPIILGTVPSGTDRICGRRFDSATAAAAGRGISVCTQTRPFRIEFKSDADETATTINMADTNEAVIQPGGIIGFSLLYVQTSC